jgi:hypothetical protein
MRARHYNDAGRSNASEIVYPLGHLPGRVRVNDRHGYFRIRYEGRSVRDPPNTGSRSPQARRVVTSWLRSVLQRSRRCEMLSPSNPNVSTKSGQLRRHCPTSTRRGSPEPLEGVKPSDHSCYDRVSAAHRGEVDRSSLLWASYPGDGLPDPPQPSSRRPWPVPAIPRHGALAGHVSHPLDTFRPEGIISPRRW